MEKQNNEEEEKQGQKQQKECQECKKKTLFNYQCECSVWLCMKHRFHDCAFKSQINKDMDKERLSLILKDKLQERI